MTYRLVRGLVIGRRQFAFSMKKGGGAGLKVPKVANFKIDVGGGGSTVTVSDDQIGGFLAVVSQFTVPENPATTAQLAKPTAAAASIEGGTIYVQRDAEDSPQNAKAVVDALAASHINVETNVQKIPSAKMPSDAQVRYFRPEDKAKAEGVLATLTSRYPAAKLVALRLPSPPGQLEVWLPKVSTAPGGT
jgi:hypothetical protein